MNLLKIKYKNLVRFVLINCVAMLAHAKTCESNIVTFINQTNKPLTIAIKTEGTEKFMISNQSFKNFKTVKLTRQANNPFIKAITLNEKKYSDGSPLVRYFNAKIASCTEPLIEINDTVLGLIEELRGKEKKIATLINHSPLTLDITINNEQHFVLAPKNTPSTCSRSLMKARKRALLLTKQGQSDEQKKESTDSMIVTTLEEKNSNIFIESLSINNRIYTTNNPIVELFNAKIAVNEFITMDASLLDELDLRQSTLTSNVP